jgi:acetyltransferase-like isoleucine patch superfamily enzyme
MKMNLKYFGLIIYYLIAKRLPNYSVPGGFFYNSLRIFCLRRIMHVGYGCRVMRNVYIGSGKNISIGNNCRINENVRLDNVKIGNHVMIARDTVFLGKTHESSEIDVPMEQQGNRVMSQSVVDDNVWIGIRSIILPSLHIKKGCIIGAGSVLTKNTEENCVYAGVPAKLIKSRVNGK